MSDEPLTYFNGEFLPRDQACVPVTDRGLLFGDSVYEVVPAYGGIPFRVSHHLERLDRSLSAIGIPNPLAHDAWRRVFERLTQQLPGEDQSIYLQVTRGAYPIRSHVVPETITPTVLAFTAAQPPRDPAMADRGLKAITLEDIRWHRCDIKATALLANVLARTQASNEGADEAILIRDGAAVEGSASNLFIVSNGLLITPPNSKDLLPGITRDLVLELAAAADIPFAQAKIGVAELEAADEIWRTSSTREVSAVVQLNDRRVGDGSPGEHWRQMDQLFQAYKEKLRRGVDCHDP